MSYFAFLLFLAGQSIVYEILPIDQDMHFELIDLMDGQVSAISSLHLSYFAFILFLDGQSIVHEINWLKTQLERFPREFLELGNYKTQRWGVGF